MDYMNKLNEILELAEALEYKDEKTLDAIKERLNFMIVQSLIMNVIMTDKHRIYHFGQWCLLALKDLNLVAGQQDKKN